MANDKNKLNTDNPDKKKYPFSFIKLRKYTYFFSLLLAIGFFLPLVMGKPINWGIDFAGGIKIQVKLPKEMTSATLNETMKELHLSAIVQSIGTKDKNEFMISMSVLNQKLQKELIDKYAPDTEKKEFLRKLEKNQPLDVVSLIKWGIESKIYKDVNKTREFDEKIDWQNAENVGPAVGAMLRNDSVKLFLVAALFMMLYLAFRFEFKYSVAAMVALLHDLTIISFFIAVAGIEIDIAVLAALLTLLGYSINDTIVIFDRIRENTSIQTKVPFIDTIDTSIWQSMSRSLMTVFTTMLADVAIIVFGGETLQGFAWTLLFGLILGTYSSVFSAAPILYDWGRFFAGRFSKGVKFESPYSV